MTAVRVGLFLVSTMGYILFANRRLKLPFAFAPSVCFAVMSCALVAAGMLGCLRVGALVLYAGGFAAGVSYFYKWRLPARGQTLFIAGYAALIAYALWLGFRTDFVAYDTYSHWGLVVKDMLVENRMPTAADTFLEYKAYPLGTSVVLYYFCRMTGLAESGMIIAQLLMRVSFIFAMTAFLRKDNWWTFPVVISCVIYAIVPSVCQTDLLVDTIMPLAAVAAFSLIRFYRETPDKCLPYAAPLLIMLVQIKQSGIFFAAVCAVYLLCLAGRRIREKPFRYLGCSVGLPAVSVILWKLHLYAVAPASGNATHSMTLSYYKNTLNGKTAGDIAEIGKLLLKSIAENPDTYIIAAAVMILALGGMWLMCRVSGQKIQARGAAVTLFALLGCMAAYLIGLYAMYIFSMPLVEALVLAGHFRYATTCCVFCVAAAGVHVIDALPEAIKQPRPIVKGGLILLCMGACLLPGVVNAKMAGQLWRSQNTDAYWQGKPENHREWYELHRDMAALREQFEPVRDGSFIVYREPSDSSFSLYLSRYIFWTGNVRYVSTLDGLRTEIDANRYDYAIICGESAAAGDILEPEYDFLGASGSVAAYGAAD